MSQLTAPIEVPRAPPKNLDPSDNALFEHHYRMLIPGATLQAFGEVVVGPSGTLWRGVRPSQGLNRTSGQPLSKLKFAKAIAREWYLGEKVVDAGTWVCDAWSREYFHWLADVLPKLILLTGERAILLPPAYTERDYIAQSLAALNIQHETISPDHLTRVRDLCAVSPVAPTGNYNPEAMHRLRIALAPRLLEQPHTRVYISRRNAPRRRIVNEAELCSTLEGFGFTSVCLEDHPWQRQIDIVSEAEVLMGLHGAGLTNMLFMREGQRVLELRRRGDAHNNCYFTLASAMDHDYYYLLCDGSSRNTFDADFTVDIGALRTTLSNMLT